MRNDCGGYTYKKRTSVRQGHPQQKQIPSLTDGERKLVVDSFFIEMALKPQEVAITLTPPFPGLGFLSSELAPRGIEPEAGLGLLIRLRFDLGSVCCRIIYTTNIFSIDCYKYVYYMYREDRCS
jgi:hypothetical protein